MNPNENDSELVGLLERAPGQVHLATRTEEIVARGRRYRRRRTAISAGGALGIVALSAGLVLALQPNGGTGATVQAGKGTIVNVDNAAFSVHTDAKTGVVSITIREIENPARLEQVLDEAGIRSSVISNPDLTCTWTGAHELNLSHVIEPPGSGSSKSPDPTALQIDPAAMPPGSVLGFVYFTSSGSAVTTLRYGLLSGEPTGCVAH